MSDEEYFKFILEKIEQIPETERFGQLKAVVAFADGKKTHLMETVIKGKITSHYYKNSTTSGYPWDKVFIIEALGKFYEELTPEENYKYNHRAWVFQKLLPFILKK